jgi:hypothetical protein
MILEKTPAIVSLIQWRCKRTDRWIICTALAELGTFHCLQDASLSGCQRRTHPVPWTPGILSRNPGNGDFITHYQGVNANQGITWYLRGGGYT